MAQQTSKTSAGNTSIFALHQTTDDETPYAQNERPDAVDRELEAHLGVELATRPGQPNGCRLRYAARSASRATTTLLATSSPSAFVLMPESHRSIEDEAMTRTGLVP